MRWSAASRIERDSSKKTVSEGLWPGRCSTRRVRSRRASSEPCASARVTSTAEPHARKLADTARRAVTMSGGIPWRSMIASAKPSSASASRPKRARYGASRSSAATSAPERRARMLASPK